MWNGRVLRVGQGEIVTRIYAHRCNWGHFYRDRDLRVTWARVPDQMLRNRIERSLAVGCRPRMGTRFPRVVPLVVNLPRIY
jgi:hypothetical protein